MKSIKNFKISSLIPGSSMIGILELSQIGEKLRLTSKRKKTTDADSVIYLTFSKLPLEEQFDVEEIEAGILKARHVMWIFGTPFLTIDYTIYGA
jgi:hypothetical protein